jgi:Negative regulator of beta-lactamase expression
MEATWNPSPNYSAGRKGRVPIAIVNHITAGAFPGCRSWLCNPQSQASAHCLINRLGEIYQLVKDEDTAWHAGIVNHPDWSLYDGANPNRYTLGIEHEGFDGTLTEAQYQAILALHKLWIAKFNLQVSTDTIIGHYRIDSVNRPNCPGPNFPWQRLFSDLQRQQVNIIVGNQKLVGFLLNDKTMVPVKPLAAVMGFTYDYDDSIPAVITNGDAIPIIIENNNGYAPIRAIVDALGRNLAWDQVNMTVTII